MKLGQYRNLRTGEEVEVIEVIPDGDPRADEAPRGGKWMQAVVRRADGSVERSYPIPFLMTHKRIG